MPTGDFYLGSIKKGNRKSEILLRDIEVRDYPKSFI